MHPVCILFSFKAEKLSQKPEHAERFTNATQKIIDQLKGVFEKTDTDKDGLVTIQEFERFRDEL